MSLLEGGPFNAIVVTWRDLAQRQALQPLIAQAKKQGIAVIGHVKGNAPDTAGLDASILAISDAKWPRIPAQWRNRSGTDRAEAGPTGAPWVDSNGWRCALASAKSPGKSIWTLAEPPDDVTGYRPAHYALAVADSAAYGATWVAAFDAETRKALASGGGKDSWNAVCDAIRFFAQRREWLSQPVAARLAVVSDFSGANEAVATEVLNLLARRHLPYRIIDRSKLNTNALIGLKAALWIDKTPEAGARSLLTRFVNSGGLLIVPANAADMAKGKVSGSFEGRFDYYPSGQGRIALASKPWSDPWLLAADTHLLLGRKQDLIRSYNAGSCNIHLRMGPKNAVAQIVSYTARPAAYPASIYVAHPYRTARWSNLNGIINQPIEVKPKGDGVEVHLPQFAPYAAIEFGEA